MYAALEIWSSRSTYTTSGSCSTKSWKRTPLRSPVPAVTEGASALGRTGLAPPRLAEAPPRLSQVLGQDLHIGQHRHEVRVSAPARDDVLVHVVVDPGSRHAAEVPA